MLWGRVRVPSGPLSGCCKTTFFCAMPFYVYILQSEIDLSFYKGFSEDVVKRLIQHNDGQSAYTKNKRPWKLVYFEELPDKRTALIREKNLKKADNNRIIALINSHKNLLKA
jgi:putative endonuclease